MEAFLSKTISVLLGSNSETNNNYYLFYQESNTFGTINLKHFTERTQLPKRPPKSIQAFQGETFELKLGLEFIFFCFER